MAGRRRRVKLSLQRCKARFEPTVDAACWAYQRPVRSKPVYGTYGPRGAAPPRPSAALPATSLSCCQFTPAGRRQWFYRSLELIGCRWAKDAAVIAHNQGAPYDASNPRTPAWRPPRAPFGCKPRLIAAHNAGKLCKGAAGGQIGAREAVDGARGGRPPADGAVDKKPYRSACATATLEILGFALPCKPSIDATARPGPARGECSGGAARRVAATLARGSVAH